MLISPAVFATAKGPDGSGNASSAVGAAPGRVEAGAGYFENRCAKCHDSDQFTRWARARPDQQELSQWLAEVLATHMTPPADEREAIIEYILASGAGEGL